MTYLDWLCQNPDKMVKIMRCPYRRLQTPSWRVRLQTPGFGCIHPKGEVTCDECKMDWLKSPVEVDE